MLDLIKKMFRDKRVYREQMERIEALPDDYRFVMKKIQRYIWSFATGDGSDMIVIQAELIELFENGAADGKHVLEVTGEDVAGFCDEIIKDTKKWTDNYHKKLNREMNNRLKD